MLLLDKVTYLYLGWCDECLGTPHGSPSWLGSWVEVRGGQVSHCVGGGVPQLLLVSARVQSSPFWEFARFP